MLIMQGHASRTPVGAARPQGPALQVRASSLSRHPERSEGSTPANKVWAILEFFAALRMTNRNGQAFIECGL
jgi:hypothetical protein